MNKLFIILITLFFLNNCSFNENSKIWKNNDRNFKKDRNIKKVFVEEKKIISEFNQGLKLNLSLIKKNNKIIDNENNLGSQKFNGEIKKVKNYKFSKLEEINHLNYRPVFLSDGIVFFDGKGSIIRYDKNQKVLWKVNHYSKAEKKLKPKLNFLLDNNKLLIADSVANYYSININTGNLNWSKNSSYPFNSDIKKYNDKMFVVDYTNTLRCYKILDGSECWNLQTENSFTISDSRYSLIISGNNIIFSNSIGDITAVDIETGLITWQLPTQSRDIIKRNYSFKNSKLVSDGNSIFFSNNNHEFYSINIKSGTIRWVNEINSYVTPIILENLILTVSTEGYLYVVDKNKGNVIRITDLYKNYKDKKRKNIKPIGFSIGDKNLYLTSNNGKMIIAEVDLGNIIKIEKVSGGLVSEPLIFNNSLYVIKNGSIIEYK